ncbi:hypothetical protein QYF36_015186 [Acer negundo]|nr:hypothetical protein QYF36_015186 [Acer negundo]
MASLLLLLSELARLQNPNSAIVKKLLSTTVAATATATATAMPSSSIRKPFTNQPNNIDSYPLQLLEHVQDSRLSIDDQAPFLTTLNYKILSNCCNHLTSTSTGMPLELQ